MKIQNFELLVGADPEFFVEQNDKPVSAHGLIPGDKKAPHKVALGAVQVDGMALEFNITPADTEENFLLNLEGVMTTILAMVPDYKYYPKPVADFEFDYIQSQPEEAKALGCEPDYNAYTMDVNPRPDVATPFRTASGHIHVGWTKDVNPMDMGHFSACARLARMMDYTLGVPSLLWDQDNRRRQLYGKAGAFRPKPYGMEYRTLSNAWLNPNPTPKAGEPGTFLRKYIYRQTIEAFSLLLQDPENDKKKIMGMSAQEIIDEGKVQTAKEAVYYKMIGSPAACRT